MCLDPKIAKGAAKTVGFVMRLKSQGMKMAAIVKSVTQKGRKRLGRLKAAAMILRFLKNLLIIAVLPVGLKKKAQENHIVSHVGVKKNAKEGLGVGLLKSIAQVCADVELNSILLQRIIV